MGNHRIAKDQLETYWGLRQIGYSQKRAAQGAGFSIATAERIERRDKNKVRGQELQLMKSLEEMPGPIPYDDLCDEAKRALEDFSYFQERYLGRLSLPWQKEAADAIALLLETDEEEYVVINAPPGSGKSTVFVHDIPIWLIIRNRAIRLMIGSATMSLAERYLDRMRRTLERTDPVKAPIDQLNRGEAKDAIATLSEDFGRFRPSSKEVWTKQAFLVEQPSDTGAVAEKEPTVSAYGIDSSFIGGRYNGVFWDDLVDPSKMRTNEKKDQLQDIYQDVCESRLEPGGLFVLQGQRLASDDLYRFALDMRAIGEGEDEDDDEDEEEAPRTPRIGEGRAGMKYHHLKFRAHYEDRCDGTQHKRTSEPYPKGCLLSPRRLSWRKLQGLMANRGERFTVVYQQEDSDPTEVLVNPDWVYGNDMFIGCIDKARDRLEIPMELQGRSDVLSVATADPSPTNYWSVQWWIYDPTTEKRYLIDHLNKKMDAPDFIDGVGGTLDKFVGVMPDWQEASQTLGHPITVWIIEANAAQRFMLQYDHVNRWRSLNDVDLIAHTTGINKTNPEFGVETIAPHWRFGRIRLPGRGEGKVRSMRLVNEVTKYPHGRTDDCVMAEWFLEWNLPNLSTHTAETTVARRPSWINSSRGLAR